MNDKALVNKNKNKLIRVAVLDAEPLFWKTCAKRFFSVILDDYQWTKNNKVYKISINFLSDKDIIQGNLTKTNYDVLLIPGGGVGDGHSISKGFKSSLKTRKWKRKIQEFIKEGGGCIGFCGGASLITSLTTGENTKPTTFVERQYNNSSLNISCIKTYYSHLAFPLFNLFQLKHPERIGTTAYVFSFEPGITKDGKRFHTGGIPIDFIVKKNNPIFQDYPEENIRIRWWGGQALIVPKNPDRKVTILLDYPKVDLYENKNTKIHAWKYIGGIRGLILAFLKAMNYIKINKLHLLEFPMLTYYFAGDWELTNKIIKSDLANRPAITTEIYPNDNNARITLCTTHPEYMVWENGSIKEQDSSKFNCLATGLYQWRNIDKLSDPIDENITHTWWLIRRLIAWTAKVPDKDMPPIAKEKLSDKKLSIISKNIFWDGTLKNQMENI
jgi:hypothetical protein